MSVVTIEATCERDALGELEVFTFDLFAVVPPEKTRHLEENGLPRIGTKLSPGDIVIGRLAKSRTHDTSVRIDDRDLYVLSFEELNKKYGHMWVNRSVYAAANQVGTVKSARLVEENGVTRAIVELDQGQSE